MGARSSRSYCCRNQNAANRHACCCLALPLHFIKSSTLPRKWCQSQWAGLSTLAGTIKAVLHRFAQRPVSWVILDSVKLTVHTNNHRIYVCLILCDLYTMTKLSNVVSLNTSPSTNSACVYSRDMHFSSPVYTYNFIVPSC